MTTGREGEAAAADFLRKNKYEIICQNYSCKLGEVDIIARKKGTLVFVEVKARAYNAYGGPVAAVTQTKQKRIGLAATNYVKEKAPKFDSIRFDVVTITDVNLEHIENAFTPQRMTL